MQDNCVSSLSPGRLIGFLNFAHALDHYVLLIYPAVVLALSRTFHREFGDLLPYSMGCFVAFGAFSMPFGWIGKHVSGKKLIALFFFGTGVSCIMAGLTQTPGQMGLALTLLGVFAAIFHSIGNAMLSGIDPSRVGRIMGQNSLFGNFGVASAALASGMLTDIISWRAAFFVPGLAALVAGAGFLLFVADPGPMRAGPREQYIIDLPRGMAKRVLGLVLVSTFVGGLIYNGTTVAMPKLFEERLADLTTSVSGVGLSVFFVFALAAFAQIAVGTLVDRFALEWIFLPLVLFEICSLLLLAILSSSASIFVALPMMSVVFGLISVHDVMTARYTLPEHRTRIYAIRYTVGFAGTAAAIPLVSTLHKGYGGFTSVFAVLAAFAVAQGIAAVYFLMVARQPASACPA